MKKSNIILILIISIVALASRFVPHMPNFSPLAAIFLFTSVYSQNKKLWLLPFIALFVSDFFIGFYHAGVMLSVYGSFLMIILTGQILKRNKNIINTASASLAAALLFFTLTNLAVWYFGNWYAPTFAGLMTSYTLAIPFFKNTIVSNLVYTGLLFGTWELVTHWSQARQIKFNK